MSIKASMQARQQVEGKKVSRQASTSSQVDKQADKEAKEASGITLQGTSGRQVGEQASKWTSRQAQASN